MCDPHTRRGHFISKKHHSTPSRRWRETRETMLRESSFDLSFINFTYDEGSFMAVYSVLGCAMLCLNTKGCLSFFYNRKTKSCSVTSAWYLDTTGLTSQVGVSYYRMAYGYGMQCSSTADCSCKNCICDQGSCQCAVGYSYQLSNGSCVMRCSEYGDSLATHEGYGVIQCNLRSFGNMLNPKACMEACRDETSFDCINAEYSERFSTCNLCDTAWFDLPEDTREYDIVGWTLFHRNCA